MGKPALLLFNFTTPLWRGWVNSIFSGGLEGLLSPHLLPPSLTTSQKGKHKQVHPPVCRAPAGQGWLTCQELPCWNLTRVPTEEAGPTGQAGGLSGQITGELMILSVLPRAQTPVQKLLPGQEGTPASAWDPVSMGHVDQASALQTSETILISRSILAFGRWERGSPERGRDQLRSHSKATAEVEPLLRPDPWPGAPSTCHLPQQRHCFECEIMPSTKELRHCPHHSLGTMGD